MDNLANAMQYAVPINAAGACLDAAMLKAMRLSRKETQTRFWGRFGVTQTRGSRFELGQEIPPPVGILIHLYLAGVVSDSDLSRARQIGRMEQISDTRRHLRLRQ